MKDKNIFILIIVFSFSFQFGLGQTLDPTFQAKLLSTGYVNDIFIQDDEKFLVVGDFHFANDHLSQSIARFNVDGTADTGFSTGSGSNGLVLTAGIQSDGKIIVGGNFTLFNGEPHNNIVRLNSDGTIDPTFDIGAGSSQNGFINCIKQDNEGQILVGGNFGSFNGTTAKGLVRLNLDGSIDPNFVLNTVFLARVEDLDFQSTNKIIITYSSGSYLESPDDVVRLNIDGSLDSTFQSDLDSQIGGNRSVNVLPDDGIAFPAVHSVSGGESGLMILSANGEEENFYSIGDVNEQFRDVANDGNGNIYFGSTTIYHFNTNTNVMEIIQPTFPILGGILGFAIHPDGTLLAGGRFITDGDSPQASFVKFNEQIQFDIGFPAKVTSAGIINSLLEMDDGKLLVGGDFFLVNDEPFDNLVRLNADGSIDYTFQQEQFTDRGSVYKLAHTSDGKILAGGFEDYSTNLFKFNSDGTLSSDFNFTAGVGPGYVDQIFESVSSDLYVSVSGFFGAGFNIPGIGTERIAKLNENGNVYPNFPSQLTASGIDDLLFNSDGKLTISGDYMQIGGEGISYRVVRLNSNWTLDDTFEPINEVKNNNSTSSVNFGRVNGILELTDGKTIIVGNFSLLDSLAVPSGLVRLGIDGEVDNSFDIGTGFTSFGEDSSIKGIQKIGVDRYIINGEMDKFNEMDSKGITIIDTDGMMTDCDFNIQSGIVNDLIIVDSTTIFAGGQFILSSTQGNVSLAKYNNVCESVGIHNPKIDNSWVTLNPNPTIDNLEVNINLKEGTGKLSIILQSLMGQVIHFEEEDLVNRKFTKTLYLEDFPAGSYFLTVQFEDKISTQKIIKL